MVPTFEETQLAIENKVMGNHIWDDDTDWEFCIIFMVLKASSVRTYRVTVIENLGLEEKTIKNELVREKRKTSECWQRQERRES